MSRNASDWRELARTNGNRVEVALLLSAAHDWARVVVCDERECRHMDFDLAAIDAVIAFERPLRDAATQLVPVAAAVNEGAMT